MPEARPGLDASMSTDRSPRVGIVMGSESDLETMAPAGEALEELGVTHELRVVSAHRSPARMVAYGSEAADRGLQVIVAGAGGAAHLPGMLAALTPLPVVGVPVPLSALAGLDSLLSIVQMPSGVPVATVAIGAGRNAGLLAARILAASDADLRQRLVSLAGRAEAMAGEQDSRVRSSQQTRQGDRP